MKMISQEKYNKLLDIIGRQCADPLIVSKGSTERESLLIIEMTKLHAAAFDLLGMDDEKRKTYNEVNNSLVTDSA